MERQLQEREFIRDGVWPGAYIHIKKYDAKQTPLPYIYGVMVKGDEKTIYMDDLETVIRRYDSLEELQNDGWLVD